MYIQLTKIQILLFCAILAGIPMVLLYMKDPVWPTKASIQLHEVLRSSEGNTTELTWQEYEVLYKTFVPKTTYNCKEIEEVGSTIQRRQQKEGIHSTCMDNVYKPKVPCIVYAFGVGYIWHFEDDFAKRGCQVFAFDPSMKTESHKRRENLWFYNIGLDGVDSDNFTPRVDYYVRKSKIFTWKVRTLKSIMKMLGHTNKTIDVLKMDIEGYEFDALSTMMDDGTIEHVRQLIVSKELMNVYVLCKTYTNKLTHIELQPRI
ncbi:unnamed protein product [Owenia fusiformis]|uniref:Uncharacterized protein n=1 Tax=Owenia fusiformis TaxID=6347 RepID=A0A8J1TLX6_OWEFU|nr:unnamed protein product [Owenia fusiformis]